MNYMIVKFLHLCNIEVWEKKKSNSASTMKQSSNCNHCLICLTKVNMAEGDIWS